MTKDRFLMQLNVYNTVISDLQCQILEFIFIPSLIVPNFKVSICFLATFRKCTKSKEEKSLLPQTIYMSQMGVSLALLGGSYI